MGLVGWKVGLFGWLVGILMVGFRGNLMEDGGTEVAWGCGLVWGYWKVWRMEWRKVEEGGVEGGGEEVGLVVEI